ncbi:MAG: hypothetical protein DRR19_04895 [Candidatus Parabeggiatoa sp. nov. 1]|nr:MAG: hypothetical protein DRR19_04895 [Gammaproteobacteria bacterium]
MKPVVTREAVESAIKQIEESGDRVTTERIRSITGGSPRTLSNLRQAIAGDNVGSSTLPLLDNKPTTKLSYHHVAKRLDTMIANRLDTFIADRLDTALSQFDGNIEEVSEPPVETNLRAGNARLKKATRKREDELLALVQKETDRADRATERLVELEKQTAADNYYTEKGERVFKNELALAVRYLLMTAGMSQKKVAVLLDLSSNDVSRLKTKGTMLYHQKKR